MKSARVDGRGGNDRIDLARITVRSRVYGGPGDDTITGSRRDDVLVGDDGEDVFLPSGGTDVIRRGSIGG